MLLAKEIDFLKLLEGIRTNFLNKLFEMITILGEETLIILIVAIIYYCFSKKEAKRLFFIVVTSTAVNTIAKNLVKRPRPFANGEITAIRQETATGYSFPSGHSQNIATLGTYFSERIKKIWFIIAASIVILVVGFSRMYLGVHTPLDVGVSILIAVVLALAIKPVIYKGEEKPLIMYIFLGVMFVLSLSFLLFVELYDFGSELDALNYASGLKNAYTLFGAILGMLAAYPFEKRFVKFDVSGKWYTQILKTTVGLGLVLAIKELLKFPLNAFLPELTVARAIRYAIMVFVAVGLYPLTFKYFKKLEDKIEARRKKKEQ